MWPLDKRFQHSAGCTGSKVQWGRGNPGLPSGASRSRIPERQTDWQSLRWWQMHAHANTLWSPNSIWDDLEGPQHPDPGKGAPTCVWATLQHQTRSAKKWTCHVYSVAAGCSPRRRRMLDRHDEEYRSHWPLFINIYPVARAGREQGECFLISLKNKIRPLSYDWIIDSANLVQLFCSL